MATVKKRKPTTEEKIKLMNAAKTGDVSAIQLLAMSGVDFTGILTIGNHWNALHYAASRGRYNAVTCLISHGAGINHMDKRQWTPLHLAARDGHTEIVDLLVKNGADINIKDNWNKTPLQGALEYDKFEVISYFVKQLKIDTKKFDDKTQQRIDELLKEAEEKQCKVNNPDLDQDILTADWRRIGYELLKPKYVKNIESTTKQSEEKCLDMLIKWLETDTSASYCKLIEALIECDLPNAANEIKEKALQQL